ncbi:MAG: cysteine desulfurase [Tissierellaceae bacterium]|nr:cysteine desulfurase [Tissierellaceae bacterium]
MIYLDNCSTTRPREEVATVIAKSLLEDFGNPSSLHRLGIRAEKKIKEARAIISNFLNVEDREIYFTSGGTESNNLAIQSFVRKLSKKGMHIITTKIEHPSVLNTMKFYEKQGFEITYLDVDDKGYISLSQLENSMRDDTILVAVMHVNNEIGIVEPIMEIGRIIKDKNPNTIFHVDGIQGFGKVDIELKLGKVDSYSFSGHKVHGPKGIGGLFIDRKHDIEPVIFGGNQERGIRSGTENLTGIIGFGEAVRLATENYVKEREHVKELKSYFADKIKAEIKDIRLNSRLDDKSSPYILNISFLDTRGEVLLHYLEENGIYVSTSSACSSRGTEKSHVLKSIGLGNREIEGAIRFCFSYENVKEEMDYTVEKLKASVSEIRQIILR